MFNSVKVNSRVFPPGNVYFHEDENGIPMFKKKSNKYIEFLLL